MARASTRTPSSPFARVPHVHYAHDVSLFAAVEKLLPLRSTEDAFPRILDAIANAQQFVHLETYIFRDDEAGQKFAAAFIACVERGVQVRLIYDDFGSIGTSPSFFRQLTNAGVEVVCYRPLAPWRKLSGLSGRDHRKILIVDGTVGFVGGFNIGNEYVRIEDGGVGWYDLCLLTGHTVAQDLELTFRRTWIKGGGKAYKLESSAPEKVLEPHTLAAVLVGGERGRRLQIRRAYLHAIRTAQKRLSLMSSYFIPDAGLLLALGRAAKRGVDVRLMVPSQFDVIGVKYAVRALYGRLLRAGVRIFEWQGPMLHAKMVVVDATWSTVGSYNFDYLSLSNLEVVLAALDPTLGKTFEDEFDLETQRCEEITLSIWKTRSILHRMLEWVLYKLRRWL